MSEQTNPTPVAPATAVTATITPPAPVPAPAPVVKPPTQAEILAARAAAQAKRDAVQKVVDLKRLADLQSEYVTLKAACGKNASYGLPGGESLARKGDVSREIDALKRKYDLP